MVVVSVAPVGGRESVFCRMQSIAGGNPLLRVCDPFAGHLSLLAKPARRETKTFADEGGIGSFDRFTPNHYRYETNNENHHANDS